MTRQEAIKILKPFRECMIDQHGCPISDAVYALDVAIKSLEEWDKVVEEIRKWYFDADIHYISKDPCVVDAMVDLFIRTIKKHLEEVKE